MHTEYYTRPRLQRHVIRILWMVPIYGVDAWLALRFRCVQSLGCLFVAYLCESIEGVLRHKQLHGCVGGTV
jgi:hypothetical protein